MLEVIDLTNLPSSPERHDRPCKKTRLATGSGSTSVNAICKNLPIPGTSQSSVMDKGKGKLKAVSEDVEALGEEFTPKAVVKRKAFGATPSTSRAPPATPIRPSENSTRDRVYDDVLDKPDASDTDALLPQQRVSIYVQAFEEMLNTVMEHEGFLFSEVEGAVLQSWNGMAYEARYLFVRLFLRKTGWFRLDKLGYTDEIGDIKRACEVMCLPTKQHWRVARDTATATPSKLRENSPDGHKGAHLDDAREKPSFAATTPPDFYFSDEALNFTSFASFSNSETPIDELLTVISLDELKTIAKQMKVLKPGMTKDGIVEALKKATKNQSTLSFGVLGQGGQLGLSFDAKGVKKGQTSVLTHKVLRITGRQLKLRPSMITLFLRLHLIYHRSFSLTEKTMTASMLARFKIRNYPKYTIKRTFSIFASRQTLLQYEAALDLEKRMEICLGESSEAWKPKAPAASQGIRGSPAKDTDEGTEKERALLEAVEVYEEAWERWKRTVEEEDEKEILKGPQEAEEEAGVYKLTYYRKRFNPGWPLTRVLYKAASMFSRLRSYDREITILTTLLSQTHFRRGKRGAWYDRLALVWMSHVGKGEDENARKEAREKAMEVCVEGLEDPWTHLIYHQSLQRRITRLESLLKIPEPSRRNFSHNVLKTATKRTLQGEKLSDGATGKKSVWRANDGGEVNVEEFSLEFYVGKKEWKGFHSENGVMTTLFCLLFWDVIFAPVDGVFEHAFQSAPLDLATDAFAIVRASLVRARLTAIESGEFLRFLIEADDRERPLKTWCVGVRWDYTKEDLVEIAEALGGTALAAICRVFAEEWGHRVGGMPDLCVWNPEKKQCRFVEVKGPGDRLSETQKVWIDLLLATGVDVELCAVEVIDEDAIVNGSSKKKRKQSKSSKVND